MLGRTHLFNGSLLAHGAFAGLVATGFYGLTSGGRPFGASLEEGADGGYTLITANGALQTFLGFFTNQAFILPDTWSAYFIVTMLSLLLMGFFMSGRMRSVKNALRFSAIYGRRGLSMNPATWIMPILRLLLSPSMLVVLAITGLFIWWYMSPFAAYSSWLLWGSIAYIFGLLLPDIDSPRSALGRFVPFVSELIPHRTITHTLWAVIVLFGLVTSTRYFWLFMLTVGYTVHIIQDSFSKQGIAWLYPLNGYKELSNGGAIKEGRRLWKYPYAVGGITESWILFLSVVGHILLFVWMYYMIGSFETLFSMSDVHVPQTPGEVIDMTIESRFPLWEKVKNFMSFGS